MTLVRPSACQEMDILIVHPPRLEVVEDKTESCIPEIEWPSLGKDFEKSNKIK